MTKLSDGGYGWKEEAPFDAILVTAGAPSIPRPLVDQLKIGGTLIIPLGARKSQRLADHETADDRESQRLTRIRRSSRGFSREELMECNFVSLVGEHGWVQREKRGFE